VAAGQCELAHCEFTAWGQWRVLAHVHRYTCIHCTRRFRDSLTHAMTSQDVLKNPNADRFGRFSEGLRILPANERDQGRWNGDPYTLDDGGDGMSEMDGGAWLLPYWMARVFGVVGAPQRR
jgi:hypothetical protein